MATLVIIMKIDIMSLIKKIFKFKMFHPAEWFVERERRIDSQVLNPASWRERKIQNEMVDRKYEESVRAKGDKENSWADKYEEDFKSMNREFTRKDD